LFCIYQPAAAGINKAVKFSVGTFKIRDWIIRVLISKLAVLDFLFSRNLQVQVQGKALRVSLIRNRQ